MIPARVPANDTQQPSAPEILALAAAIGRMLARQHHDAAELAKPDAEAAKLEGEAPKPAAGPQVVPPAAGRAFSFGAKGKTK